MQPGNCRILRRGVASVGAKLKLRARVWGFLVRGSGGLSILIRMKQLIWPRSGLVASVPEALHPASKPDAVGMECLGAVQRLRVTDDAA